MESNSILFLRKLNCTAVNLILATAKYEKKIVYHLKESTQVNKPRMLFIYFKHPKIKINFSFKKTKWRNVRILIE